jgi:hypothetical protein
MSKDTHAGNSPKGGKSARRVNVNVSREKFALNEEQRHAIRELSEWEKASLGSRIVLGKPMAS